MVCPQLAEVVGCAVLASVDPSLSRPAYHAFQAESHAVHPPRPLTRATVAAS